MSSNQDGKKPTAASESSSKAQTNVQSMSPPERRPVSADSLQSESFKKGQTIFSEDDVSSHFYIVKSGVVQIFTKSVAGSQVDIFEIHEGETFGEFALLDRRPRSASALALTDVDLLKVTEAGYEHMLTELPLWAASMMRSFTRRLRVMNARIRALQED